MNQEPTDFERNRTMMALRAHQRGGPEQLIYEEAPKPVPGPDEVLIAVRAAAITLAELTWPETWTAEGVDRTPVIPSHEFAGVVAEGGANVQEFVAGDSVFGLVPFDRDGAAAEFLTVPAACVAKKGPLVPDVTAAAAVLPALTAWEALIDQADLRPGQRILIRGGAGAVGSFLTQFAKAMGAEVTATVRSASAVGRTKSLGADHVITTGHSLDIPRVSGFDVVVDAVGADVPEWMYAAPRPGGHLIVLQEPPNQELAAKYGVTATFFIVRTRRDRLQQLAARIANDEVEVAAGLMFPLASGRAAYEAKPSGKTVLTVE
ncbi:NADP-dependent oxidoreductase [Arthrobacter sp. ISL-85]|uniref:NADP-dependent oxidoreductase n=1 Tax=Arthrobacter sp. ISL-85 TaxID=2819115 RepID=UPI001BE4E951|nr:NADP-dependent oxidoreductase [Arthrobacter sp. ISL-85]MBT2566356.1 NADP-dependent oxidoreductase [Arthrobacter sp. ISL-85]